MIASISVLGKIGVRSHINDGPSITSNFWSSYKLSTNSEELKRHQCQPTQKASCKENWQGGKELKSFTSATQE